MSDMKLGDDNPTVVDLLGFASLLLRASAHVTSVLSHNT